MQLKLCPAQNNRLPRLTSLFAATLMVAAATCVSTAQTFTVLATFSGSDGLASTPAQDAHGNIYGVTAYGGQNGDGSVFKLDAHKHLTTLYSFKGGSDGERPNPDLALDNQGNLYGTTNIASTGAGEIFELTATRHLTVLYRFCSLTNCTDGGDPRSGVVRDAAGNLYGTTAIGGGRAAGVAYKLSPSGKYVVLHAFIAGHDGLQPWAPVALDTAGNVYGTTLMGGERGIGGCQLFPGCGTTFKIDSTGHETILHVFRGGSDGVAPFGPVVLDQAGNVFGMTFIGGSDGCPPPNGRGCGTIYQIDKTGKETVLYRWPRKSPNEFDPFAGLVRDKQGNLYGVTQYGGDFNCAGGSGCGTVFKFDTKGKLTVLHTFTGGTDGAFPRYRMILDSNGNLYGTTGGDSELGIPGTLFKITL